MTVIEVKTTVLPDGGIRIDQTDLPAGQEVTVRISIVDMRPKRKISEILAEYQAGLGHEAVEEVGRNARSSEKKTFLENLGGYRGGELFQTGAEVDEYFKEERGSWGD